MKTRLLSAVVMAALLTLGLFAGPALAQDSDPDDFPEEVEFDEVLGEYVLDVVIIADEEEPEPQPEPEPEEEPEVLGVTEERLPVTGGDLLGLALGGVLLVGLGYLALRRGRSTRPSPDHG